MNFLNINFLFQSVGHLKIEHLNRYLPIIDTLMPITPFGWLNLGTE